MGKELKQQSGSPAERILDVASDLFYRQGYRATGINEVIKESGVAKATFYNHFPTKDDLCYAYLEGVRVREKAYVDGLKFHIAGAVSAAVSGWDQGGAV